MGSDGADIEDTVAIDATDVTGRPLQFLQGWYWGRLFSAMATPMITDIIGTALTGRTDIIINIDIRTASAAIDTGLTGAAIAVI